MTQPAPGYQPYQPMAPMMGVAAPPKPSRGGLTTLIAGLLALVVAGLAVGGSFGVISSVRNSYGAGDDTRVFANKVTWWQYADDGSSSPLDSENLLTGLTLVLAAALLVLGAVFAFVGARSRGSGPVSAARSMISAGVGVLAGAGLLELFMVLKQLEGYREQELDAGEAVGFNAGLGLWLPLGGLLLGIVAVVLAHVGGRPSAARFEPNTPKMGFPAPYGYRPQMPAQQVAPVAERRAEVRTEEARTEETRTEEDDASDTQRVSDETARGGAPQPVTPSAPSAPSSAEAPAPLTPATTSSAEAPSVTPSAPPATEAPAAPADGVEKNGAEKQAPSPDLPQAPPAPELSSSDEKDKDGK